jgi:hypothetical protein
LLKTHMVLSGVGLFGIYGWFGAEVIKIICLAICMLL